MATKKTVKNPPAAKRNRRRLLSRTREYFLLTGITFEELEKIVREVHAAETHDGDVCVHVEFIGGPVVKGNQVAQAVEVTTHRYAAPAASADKAPAEPAASAAS